MSLTGTRIKKGDTVRVITGKDKGKEGKVMNMIAPDLNPKKQRPARLRIEGINIVIKHQRARQIQNPTPGQAPPKSGRIEMEAPIYASKVQIVCPHCAKTTRVGITTNEKGERFRTCKQCDKRLD
jgi:large subunit ribosomal protein L24